FTPNGDASNQTFFIKGLDQYPNTQVIIFNRWGRKVYESSNYQNDWNGEDCADGVYYYIINFVDYLAPAHGTVTIMR
ncbi:MAG: gliding motility-associated C-terminal domain-containing protein, partial [Bacteroidota bacterium]